MISILSWSYHGRTLVLLCERRKLHDFEGCGWSSALAAVMYFSGSPAKKSALGALVQLSCCLLTCNVTTFILRNPREATSSRSRHQYAWLHQGGSFAVVDLGFGFSHS